MRWVFVTFALFVLALSSVSQSPGGSRSASSPQSVPAPLSPSAMLNRLANDFESNTSALVGEYETLWSAWTEQSRRLEEIRSGLVASENSRRQMMDSFETCERSLKDSIRARMIAEARLKVALWAGGGGIALALAGGIAIGFFVGIK
jgi:hypothetical protein